MDQFIDAYGQILVNAFLMVFLSTIGYRLLKISIKVIILRQQVKEMQEQQRTDEHTDALK